MVRFQPSYAHKPTTAGAPPYIQVRTAKQKLFLGTCAVGAAQWARRGRTSKITETAREARHVAMGKPESTGPVPQAEARGQHMSDHPGGCSGAQPAPNRTTALGAKRGVVQRKQEWGSF